MKKKIISLLLGTVMLLSLLTGCIQNDIGVKMNKDGTGAITATIGIEKEFYQQLKSLGSDPFEGKTTAEYTYDDKTYVSYAETKEYSSYEEMEQALLEMTYDTDLIEEAQDAQNEQEADNSLDDTITDDENVFDVTINGEPVTPDIEVDTEPLPDIAPEQDNHIFSSVNIEKNSGIFYSSYTFNAVLNPQSNEGLDYDMNETFKVTLSVEMPEEITQAKGGTIEGNKVTFDIADITESQEVAATCEANNVGVVVGVALVLVAIVVGFFCFVKFKK